MVAVERQRPGLTRRRQAGERDRRAARVRGRDGRAAREVVGDLEARVERRGAAVGDDDDLVRVAEVDRGRVARVACVERVDEMLGDRGERVAGDDAVGVRPVVDQDRPGLADGRLAGQQEEGPRRLHAHLDEVVLAVVGRRIECLFGVVGAGLLRGDVDVDRVETGRS